MNKAFKQPFWIQLAKGITGNFGENCEVVIHDLTEDEEHSIIYIENGHVTGRKVGTGRRISYWNRATRSRRS
jgi:predicted transcriptional regulator YheO